MVWPADPDPPPQEPPHGCEHVAEEVHGLLRRMVHVETSLAEIQKRLDDLIKAPTSVSEELARLVNEFIKRIGRLEGR